MSETRELESLSDAELTLIFSSILNGNYADHFHPLSAEVMAQYEHMALPLPTEITTQNTLQVDYGTLFSALGTLMRKQSVVIDYLLLTSDDLRACLAVKWAATRCLGCHEVGRDLSDLLTTVGYVVYNFRERGKMVKFVREDRLPQGTMMFLYRRR